ncbi:MULTISPECIES: AIR synthase-related protein [Desulfovibrio]|uniref:Phosphoribosylformylglycinamidine synthase subunit PurL n=2 Tax=Desulfovibrio desulfuricans TaxID=876 RepID=A0AA94HRL2_DESDE|nr:MULTISPECIES: AIR synthase-related protein [Desulfovibrio]ATD80442.1 phosphoribosylformylglycinamidine synthase [Desulfovibrio sp. G11]SFW32229.1 phosphoribosylformylglycinamidine synthase [Desulfovibrio desulfuricans]SPD35923.1 phosphoribosylformylglycinamidine synthase [Desulfovibrio sp. G11]
MLYRVETGLHAGLDDTQGRKTAQHLRKALDLSTGSVRQIKVFTAEGFSESQVKRLLDEGIWHDPILQAASLEPLPSGDPTPDWYVEVGFRPGVTDNEARTARDTAAMVLDVPRDSLHVYTAVQYRIVNDPAAPLSREQVDTLTRDLLCNTLIQRYRIKSRDEWQANPGFEAQAAQVTGESNDTVETIGLSDMDDEALMQASRSNTWALNLKEMHCIRDQFSAPQEARRRKALDLPGNPTDVEMEVLAQTWSEHCKHKIFASRIEYTDEDTGRREVVDNLYKTCIRDATAILRERMGENDYCKSVFKDNAGVIAFINGYDACIKVETHNSPSALDPYGGALTGIVGVNRDPMGTGMGAELVCNTDVFCFASPFHDKPLPPRLLHPRRVLEGVREGVEHGGNKSGVPTVNGSLVFDERFLGKPLVYCGTVGIIPAELHGRPGWYKKAETGDFIVMTGGRIGKDGIHGATFSSEELHEGSPATAVQIGDPITQRKMYDFIIRARDLGLYNAITDNGAGGLSSSVGEMAEDTGGCVLDIAKAPLKYDGLRPWEILLSEAQERMTLAVPPAKLDEFMALAARMDVEATALGTFTESGYFEVRYNDRIVASMPMSFMHEGVPQLELEAVWKTPEVKEITVDMADADQGAFLKRMLSRLNICSKEYIIRQYDHEVRGGSVIKPLVGVKRDGPADAGVLRPLLESDAGLVISHGICPKFSEYDTYWMMANAMDEAIRNAVAVGADPDALAGVDNFCWCDPVVSPTNPDGRYKLAQLVRACRALRQFSLAFGVPCISGKDSMKNDYTGGGERISIPPTVLFSILGVIRNVTATQTSDFKKEGDHIYLLGGTWREMAGSEAADELGLKGGRVPHVDAGTAMARYRAVSALMGQRAISACHDCSDGGLAVALAEMCIGGRLGAELNLDAVPAFQAMNKTELLYSESASRLLVSVKPDLAMIFDALGQWQICTRIGTVTGDSHLTMKSGDSVIAHEHVDDLARAFKVTLDW